MPGTTGIEDRVFHSQAVTALTDPRATTAAESSEPHPRTHLPSTAESAGESQGWACFQGRDHPDLPEVEKGVRADGSCGVP